jgi:hypothetical protein
MKNSILILSLTGIFLFLASCKKDDSSPASASGDPALVSGKTWKVTHFYDDKDETYKFTNFTFDFAAGGVLTATAPAGSTTGTWSISSSKFFIDLGASDPLRELTDDWRLLEQTSDLIKLRDDNDEKLEELHFSRL